MSHERTDDDDDLQRDNALQFEEAEYGPEAGAAGDKPACLVCGVCGFPVASVYYEIGGRVVCEECRGKVEASMTGGSKISRVVRAFVFGTAAGVGGFLIYFAVLKFANLQIGLISILVGFMVGAAVRKGSDHRGGWFYQLMAMFLTYSAVVASYSAVILPKVFDDLRRLEANEAPPEGAGVDNHAAVGGGGADAPPRETPDVGAFLMAWTVFVAMLGAWLYTLPVMVGMQQPIGLLIVAFALWEAWKLNVRPKLMFAGPFRVGGGEGDATATGVYYA